MGLSITERRSKIPLTSTVSKYPDCVAAYAGMPCFVSSSTKVSAYPLCERISIAISEYLATL